MDTWMMCSFFAPDSLQVVVVVRGAAPPIQYWTMSGRNLHRFALLVEIDQRTFTYLTAIESLIDAGQSVVGFWINTSAREK